MCLFLHIYIYRRSFQDTGESSSDVQPSVCLLLSLFKVILIENKEESLVRAQSRSAELGLENVGFIQANLDYFTGPFHVGVSRATEQEMCLSDDS